MENIKERTIADSKANYKSTSFQISQQPGYFRILTRALRISQWVKNLLIFLPFLLAHKILHWPNAKTLISACLSLCFCTSAMYIVNDIADIKADRRHPVKRYRPIANGDLRISSGIRLSLGSLVMSLVIAGFFLKPTFLIIPVLYCICSLLYSFKMKKLLLADILTLATLYTLRIYAGGFVLDIPISNWLLAFSLCFFMSLALLKRYSELHQVGSYLNSCNNNRYYKREDRNVVQIMGVGMGLLSVLVLVLYLQNKHVTVHYSHPGWLWFIVPLLLYWISRIWFLAERGIVKDDPVVFSVTDRTSYLVGAAAVSIFALSSWL